MLQKFNKEEKEKYLLQKYNKQEQEINIEDYKQYAVMWKPEEDQMDAWQTVAICSTYQEAIDEITWRLKFHKTNNTQIVLEKDKRFNTFTDETQNKNKLGNTIEPNEYDMYCDDVNALQPHNNNPYDLPAEKKPQKSGFKTLSHYGRIDLNYRGLYRIDTVFKV
jgi:hypothetical protein